MSKNNIPDPSVVAHKTEAIAIEEFQGPIDGVCKPCATWVKVSAKYNDRWNTPMAGAEFNLWVKDQLILDKKKLKDYDQVGLKEGEAPHKDPEQQKIWFEKYNQLGTFMVPKTEFGKARFELTKSSSSDEKQIAAINKAIEARLDGEYRNLIKQMAPFQQIWDQLGIFSIRPSYKAGQRAGGESWVEDQQELLTWKYWQEIGDAITTNTPKLYDTAKTMGLEFAEDSIQEAEEMWKKRGNLANPNWWEAEWDAFVEQNVQAVTSAKDYIEESVNDAYKSSETAYEIFKRKDAIFAIPNLIAAGDIDEIEAFIDTDLYAIDPEWANQLRYNKDWQEFIEVLQDGEAAANFVVYLDLMIKVTPPNFYSFYFGKGAFYIQIEVALLVLGVLLGGAGAAARIAVLTARITNMAAKSNQVVKKSQEALQAYQRAHLAFIKVTQDMDKLRELLIKNRRHKAKSGASGTELEQRRETTKRDGKCRICQSKDHNTPLHRSGNLEYRE